MAAVANVATVNLTSGNTTTLAVGTYVNGPGIGFGDTVASVGSGTAFNLSANRTVTAGHEVIFGGLMLNNGAVFGTDPAGLVIDQPVIINNNSTGGFTGLYPITVNANLYKIQGGNDITLSNSLERSLHINLNYSLSNSLDQTARSTKEMSDA